MSSKTKEEEYLLDQKIAAIRKRNEALERRRKEIEEDKRLAEARNAMVQLRPVAGGNTSRERMPALRPSNREAEIGCDNGGGGDSPISSSRGRGERDVFRPRNFDSKVNRPPRDPLSFLADPDRDIVPSGAERWGGGRRQEDVHREEYGSRDSRNHHNRGEGDEKGAPREVGVRRKEEAWRAERSRIDEARIQRQRTAEGRWRREWDNNKLRDEEGESEKVSANELLRSVVVSRPTHSSPDQMDEKRTFGRGRPIAVHQNPVIKKRSFARGRRTDSNVCSEPVSTANNNKVNVHGLAVDTNRTRCPFIVGKSLNSPIIGLNEQACGELKNQESKENYYRGKAMDSNAFAASREPRNLSIEKKRFSQNTAIDSSAKLRCELKSPEIKAKPHTESSSSDVLGEVGPNFLTSSMLGQKMSAADIDNKVSQSAAAESNAKERSIGGVCLTRAVTNKGSSFQVSVPNIGLDVGNSKQRLTSGSSCSSHSEDDRVPRGKPQRLKEKQRGGLKDNNSSKTENFGLPPVNKPPPFPPFRSARPVIARTEQNMSDDSWEDVVSSDDEKKEESSLVPRKVAVTVDNTLISGPPKMIENSSGTLTATIRASEECLTSEDVIRFQCPATSSALTAVIRAAEERLTPEDSKFEHPASDDVLTAAVESSEQRLTPENLIRIERPKTDSTDKASEEHLTSEDVIRLECPATDSASTAATKASEVHLKPEDVIRIECPATDDTLTVAIKASEDRFSTKNIVTLENPAIDYTMLSNSYEHPHFESGKTLTDVSILPVESICPDVKMEGTEAVQSVGLTVFNYSCSRLGDATESSQGSAKVTPDGCSTSNLDFTVEADLVGGLRELKVGSDTAFVDTEISTKQNANINAKHNVQCMKEATNTDEAGLICHLEDRNVNCVEAVIKEKHDCDKEKYIDLSKSYLNVVVLQEGSENLCFEGFETDKNNSNLGEVPIADLEISIQQGEHLQSSKFVMERGECECKDMDKFSQAISTIEKQECEDLNLDRVIDDSSCIFKQNETSSEVKSLQNSKEISGSSKKEGQSNSKMLDISEAIVNMAVEQHEEC